MEGERAGDPGDRVEVDLADVAVAGEELLELRLVLLDGVTSVTS